MSNAPAPEEVTRNSAKAPAPPNKRLYIGNLPVDVEAAEAIIEKMFPNGPKCDDLRKKNGRVDNLYQQISHFCFVTYETVDDATIALKTLDEKLKDENSSVKVDYAYPPPPSDPGATDQAANGQSPNTKVTKSKRTRKPRALMDKEGNELPVAITRKRARATREARAPGEASASKETSKSAVFISKIAVRSNVEGIFTLLEKLGIKDISENHIRLTKGKGAIVEVGEGKVVEVVDICKGAGFKAKPAYETKKSPVSDDAATKAAA